MTASIHVLHPKPTPVGGFIRIRHTELDPAVRSARRGARLRIPDEKVAKIVINARARLVRLRDSLGALHDSQGTVTRAQPIAFRGRGTMLDVVARQ